MAVIVHRPTCYCSHDLGSSHLGLLLPDAGLGQPRLACPASPHRNPARTTPCTYCRTVLQEDDEDIKEEGLESLTVDELRQACRARGMRAPFGEGSAEFMRQQLAEWIDWSLNK